MPSGFPDPTPPGPISERLEHVRKQRGDLSRRAFWLKLGKKDAERDVVTWTAASGESVAVSYPAVRNYHYDRDPPISYLARVSRVYWASLEWLVLGRGPWDMTAQHIWQAFEGHDSEAESTRSHADDAELDAAVDKAVEAFEEKAHREHGITDDPLLQQPAARELFRLVWERWTSACPAPPLDEPTVRHVGQLLLSYLHAPLLSWGTEPRTNEENGHQHDYVFAMLQALSLCAPLPGRGPRIPSDPGSSLKPAPPAIEGK